MFTWIQRLKIKGLPAEIIKLAGLVDVPYKFEAKRYLLWLR